MDIGCGVSSDSRSSEPHSWLSRRNGKRIIESWNFIIDHGSGDNKQWM